MKKIFIILLAVAAVATASAQVTSLETTPSITNPAITPGSHTYYYYPSTNVYLDEANGNYWYKDRPSAATWKRTRTLPPPAFNPGKAPRYKLAYKGIDP